ncbi:MAG: DUF4974 domain-containing protein, partial [Muribaculaceae bacterium]|nr:DUF4974 domain-containing protein [Muribaculaceae bacterium]
MIKSTSHYQQWRSRMGVLCVMGLATLASAPALQAATVMTQDNTTGLYTVKATDTTVKDVLGYIEKNSDYVFMYGEGVEKKLSTVVDIQLKDKKMDAVLAELCSAAGLKYSISGRQVTITMAAKATKSNAPKSKITGTILDENGDPM